MADSLKFGYLIPTRDAVMRAPDGRADIQRMIGLAVRAENKGFDSVWIGDSLLARPRFEALTTLSAIAALTKRVELGTAVYLSPLRHPLPLAHTAGNLDLISGGRFLFGIGLGPKSTPVRAEYAACGIDFSKRGIIEEEGIRIMKGLWQGQPFSFQGRQFTLQDVKLYPLPARPGGPPILLAGASEKPLRRIARYADGWLPISHDVPEFLANWKELQDYCTEYGRDPNSLLRILYLTLNVNRDAAKAHQETEEFLEAYYGSYHTVISQTQGIHSGEPESCADFIRSFVQAGVSHVIIRFAASDQETQMDRLLSEVIPLLR